MPGLDTLTPVEAPAFGDNSGIADDVSGACVPGTVYDRTLAPTAAAIAHFRARIVAGPSCWIWTGAISAPDGYGRITWRAGGRARTLSAHRFALLLAEGEAIAGGVAEHRCNEPLCVRVDGAHVIASTQAANARYAVACGRTGPLRHGTPVSRVARSRAVREAVRDGWNGDAYQRAAGLVGPGDTPPLF